MLPTDQARPGRSVLPSSAESPLRLVLTCGSPACRHTFEPDPAAYAVARLACPRCGGWTFAAELAEPTTGGEGASIMTEATLSSHSVAVRWWRHTVVLLAHRDGHEILAPDLVAVLALAALRDGRDLVCQVHSWRPLLAVEALAAGASHADVATARGMTTADLQAWLTSWANEQQRLGLIDHARHGEVLRLAGGGSDG